VSWPVRSRLLAVHSGNLVAGTDLVLATVPAGKTWLIKDMTAYNGTAGSRSFYFGITSAGVRVLWHGSSGVGAAGVLWSGERHIVLPAGGQVFYVSGGAGAATCQVSGAQLG
jgi:hypothetical protein